MLVRCWTWFCFLFLSLFAISRLLSYILNYLLFIVQRLLPSLGFTFTHFHLEYLFQFFIFCACTFRKIFPCSMDTLPQEMYYIILNISLLPLPLMPNFLQVLKDSEICMFHNFFAWKKVYVNFCVFDESSGRK